MNKQHLNFEVEQTDIIDENPDSQFATAKIRAFSSGASRNDTYCSEEVLQATAHTLDNKPIVYNINNTFGDFGTHTDPENSLIAGFVVPGSQEFERLSNGRLALSVLAKLWKRYSPKAMEIFKKDGGKKSVSVELDLLDSDSTPDGLKNMKDFVYSAVCVLGDLVSPGIENAQLEMMSFAEENAKYKEAVALEFGRYDDIDMSIPESVKKNVAKGLELYKQFGIGGTSVSLASAHFVSKSDKITPEKLRHIAKVHKSNKFKSRIKSPPNEAQIAFLLYGGSDGATWASEISGKLDEMDNQRLSYFEEITFPYKTIGDINPALKGIKPPISLSQANAIAKQADAIGTDEKKNGWAIAISSFKKTHTVVDGKWVEKEKKNMEDEKDLKKSEEEEMAVAPPDEKPEEENMAEKPAETKDEEKPAEEGKEETPAEEKKEEDKENMSLDSNLDVKAMLAMLADETEAYKKVSADFEAGNLNMGELFALAYSKMCKMAEDNKKFEEENMSLKAFKAKEESEKFAVEVAATMKDIEEKSEMPDEKRNFLLEESKKFSLDTIDAWKNLAKAEAFSFAKKGSEENTELRFANPWQVLDSSKKSSPWDNL